MGGKKKDAIVTNVMNVKAKSGLRAKMDEQEIGIRLALKVCLRRESRASDCACYIRSAK